MHDGIHVEKAGKPAVTICTDIFIETSKAMADMWDAPDFPMIFTQHPIANLTRAQLRERAEGMLDEIVTILTDSPSVTG